MKDGASFHSLFFLFCIGSVKNYLIFYCSNLDLWESANKKSIDLPF